MKALTKDIQAKNNLLSFIFAFFIFLISLIIVLSFFSSAYKMPIKTILFHFKNSLYIPSYNMFPMNNIFGINVLILYFIFLIFALCLSLTSYKVAFIFYPKISCLSGKRITINVIFISLLFFICVQQFSRIDYFIKEKTWFHAKSLYEKDRYIFGDIFTFSEKCQKILKKNHKGILLTDLDLNQDAWMQKQMALSYLLYPRISLAYSSADETICLVLFHKKDPRKSIPQDYKILISADDDNLILAVNKKDLDQ